MISTIVNLPLLSAYFPFCVSLVFATRLLSLLNHMLPCLAPSAMETMFARCFVVLTLYNTNQQQTTLARNTCHTLNVCVHGCAKKREAYATDTIRDNLIKWLKKPTGAVRKT